MTDIELFIRDEAALRAIDGQVAIDVANSEGGVEEYARHGSFNTGDSWWAYQLHYGGPEYPQFGVPGESVAGMGNSFSSFTGWGPGDPEAWRDAARYALNTAKRDGWGAWYGAVAIGITGYDGIDTSVAWDPNSQTWDYETAGGTVPEPPPTEPFPVFDPSFPAFAQNDSWSCSSTSARWALWAYGRQPSEQWIESTMLAEGVVTTQYGLMDASGAGLADFLNRHYGEYGYVSTNDPSVTFDDVAGEAATEKHPLMMGGRTWSHWTGVRGFDPSSQRLLLANPASGWMGVTQTMTEEQFRYLGPFSMVRLTHPAAEAALTPPPQPPVVDYAPPGTVGTGLLAMMAEDGTQPAMPSTWLPLGQSPALAEQCWGINGTQYLWLLTTNTGYRFRPS